MAGGQATGSHTSFEEGELPTQWRHAKTIPLRKPGKEDYTIAKAWRPISLLSTLGKVMESVIAERISHLVETFGSFQPTTSAPGNDDQQNRRLCSCKNKSTLFGEVAESSAL